MVEWLKRAPKQHSKPMFGFLGIPSLGGFVGFHAMFVCLLVPKLRRFAPAAFVVPLALSIVWWVGVFILIYMNEHG